MSLKDLRSFQNFDMESFLKGKQLLVKRCSEFKDFTTQKHLGTKVEVMISADNTAYPPRKDGTPVEHVNLFEPLVFKVAKDLTFPVMTEVVAVNPTATVYGEYQNQLSCFADDIQAVKAAAKNP